MHPLHPKSIGTAELTIGPHLTLFLGAGASLAAPAGAALFGEIRRALVERTAGTRGPARPEARLLLEHVLPEVLLKEFTDAGYDLYAPLSHAIGFPDGTQAPDRDPNPLHELAADVLLADGRVWTTNWDCFIETAYRAKVGSGPPRAVHGGSLDPAARLVKPHGSIDEPASLAFRSSDVLRPMQPSWTDRLVDDFKGRTVAIVGYSGADLDLFPALKQAISSAARVLWFEGSETIARELAWRFELPIAREPHQIPRQGAALVWCGEGSAHANPTDAALALFGRAPVGDTISPSAEDAFRTLRRHPTDRASLFLAARVDTRLGLRWRAAGRLLLVVLVGPGLRARRRAARWLSYLVVLRRSPLRRIASGIAQRVSRGRRYVFQIHAGQYTDQSRQAEAIRAGKDVPISDALGVATQVRQTGDLRLAEQVARGQLVRALEANLDDPDFDWPERIALASYEIAQARLERGDCKAAEDESRIGYMRMSGAKWLAWELHVRACCLLVRDDLNGADQLFIEVTRLLDAEGFPTYTPYPLVGRSACARRAGAAAAALPLAQKALKRAAGEGGRTTALIELAELAIEGKRSAEALNIYEEMLQSTLLIPRAIARLRLSELSTHTKAADQLARDALHCFRTANCDWGILRTQFLLGEVDRDELRAAGQRLGCPVTLEPDTMYWA